MARTIVGPRTIVGIDVGGTFTDIAILEDGRLSVHKLPSTPADPSLGITQGIGETNVNIANTDFIHGSTVATNALLEGKGGRTALVTTLGFEDVLEIGRQNRADLYDLSMERPAPLSPWQLRFGLPERIDYTGAILEDLTPESVDALLSLLNDAEIDGIAVSFLFSFLNPVHEETLAQRLSELPSKPFISISSKILPEFREYERTSTVVVNSYVGPVMARYLTQLESVLGRGLRVMQSSGGSITASLAAEQPVRTILSGPAGGVVGAFYTGIQAGYPDIITLDMGGTSTDVSLCPGRIKETTAANLGGYPVSVPMIEIHTVGAGGGSIARVDAGGALVVGPQSAGADPGPACYGRGDRITVTDANLTLGRLRPDGFLGGRMTLDLQRSQTLLADLAGGIGASATDTALGIIRVVNSNMERAIRAISLERGYDPREFTLIPFGGAGPMHACELAAELGIPRVLVPGYPGILSALGVAIADVVKDYSRTVMLRGDDLDQARLDAEFRGMEQLARAELLNEALPADDMTPRRFLDVRYVGQSFELTVDCPALDTHPVTSPTTSRPTSTKPTCSGLAMPTAPCPSRWSTSASSSNSPWTNQPWNPLLLNPPTPHTPPSAPPRWYSPAARSTPRSTTATSSRRATTSPDPPCCCNSTPPSSYPPAGTARSTPTATSSWNLRGKR